MKRSTFKIAPERSVIHCCPDRPIPKPVEEFRADSFPQKNSVRHKQGGWSSSLCALTCAAWVVANIGLCLAEDGPQSDSRRHTVQPIESFGGSFQNSLLGTPFSIQNDFPDTDRGKSIRRVSYDSNVTFLRASSSSSIKDPEPNASRASQQTSNDKPAAVGNVTLITQQSPATATPQSPPAEVSQPAAPANESDPNAITAEVLAARRAAAAQMSDLSDDVKAQIAKIYQHAAELLAQKADAEKKAAEFRTDKENGPALIADHRATLSQPAPKAEPEYPPSSSVADLEKLRLVDEEKAAEASRLLEAWETRAKLRVERKPQLPSLIETTRQQLVDLEKTMLVPAPEGESPVLSVARRTEQEALALLLRAQLDLYRHEQLLYEAWNELFPLQRDVLIRTRNTTDKRMELWKEVIATARRTESEKQALEAREKLRNAHPTLRDLAEENSRLTLRRKELQGFLATQVSDLSAVNATLLSVEKKFTSVVEKEQRAGLTTAIGLMLRNQRSHLPQESDYDRRQDQAEQDIVRIQTEQMALEDDRNDLGDIETQVEATLLLNAEDKAMQTRLREMTLELLTDRRRYLDDLLADYDSCLLALSEIDVTCRRLQVTIHRYKDHIDERVLWIRSAAPADSTLITRTWKDTRSFLSHRQWSSLLQFLMTDARTFWLLYTFCGLSFLLIMAMNHQIRRSVSRLGEISQQPLESGIPQTLLATALTVVNASGWPALFLFAGWRLSLSGQDLALALGTAFRFCAAALWLVDTFRMLCRRTGVTVKFLEWPLEIAGSLQRNLLSYILIGIPLSFIAVVANQFGEGACSETAGRFVFVLFCLLLAFILRRFAQPSSSVIGELLRTTPASLMFRLRWIWYPLAVGAPIALAILALMGYQYTAEQLMFRLQLTLVLSFVLIFTYSMLMQWMLAARRNLAIRQSRARRAAALAVAQRENEDGAATDPIPPAEIPVINISLLNQQVLRLLQGSACLLFLTICWGIWGQVLPALQVFSRIELWSVLVETSEPAEDALAGIVARQISRRVPVTLGHLLISAVLFSAAILASRNIPGLLELGVLQKLPLDHGGRNAVTTLCRYAFLLVGIVLASNTLGISWGSVQWLVAALTVGLGFGLQEIFANFVSGLIILFERPVRIGDIVTIDGVSGSVSRIEIRATTITDWDRKEFIIPNKELVTGKVLNWTLSDKTNRIVINVGVGYGTDVEFAMSLLQKAAEAETQVLTDPAPVVSFEGFGDSTLNLTLRCFLPNFDHRLKVLSQLHVAINQRFREADIEIAFPQRDVHIRSLPAQFADFSGPGNQLPTSSSPTKSEPVPPRSKSA